MWLKHWNDTNECKMVAKCGCKKTLANTEKASQRSGTRVRLERGQKSLLVFRMLWHGSGIWCHIPKLKFSQNMVNLIERS
eukprot:NODE_867_length_1402_cov_37.869919_g722_i0.p4 GENE.NODE_867_length_1402_cov_37.869919_g722_i0~~NODE_867_length_1402_cov_37.869919_g722_i0.p4  ORF type:complete len:80 (+),score=5.74 NODE_867_length_1402_cov_37.869919_g722_i0:577-816(+)